MTTETKPKSVLGWHFLRNDMRSARGHEGPWQIGEKRSVLGLICICFNGYHMSRRAVDAGCWYRTVASDEAAVLCRVRILDDIIEERNEYVGYGKSVGRTRQLLWCLSPEETTSILCTLCGEGTLDRLINCVDKVTKQSALVALNAKFECLAHEAHRKQDKKAKR